LVRWYGSERHRRVLRLGLRPARIWALVAALAEFGGGLLTALGLLGSVGPALLLGAIVSLASTRVRRARSQPTGAMA
jgi:putative oxidoreductase